MNLKCDQWVSKLGKGDHRDPLSHTSSPQQSNRDFVQRKYTKLDFPHFIGNNSLVESINVIDISL